MGGGWGGWGGWGEDEKGGRGVAGDLVVVVMVMVMMMEEGRAWGSNRTCCRAGGRGFWEDLMPFKSP